MAQMPQTPADIISGAGFPVYLHGFSAIDSYLGRNNGSRGCAVHVICGAELSDLARLFDGLRYPGAALADAALDCGEKTWYFRCGEPGETPCSSFAFLEFYQDYKTQRFFDPNGIYPHLRFTRDGVKQGEASDCLHSASSWLETKKTLDTYGSDLSRALIDGALILTRYFPEASIKEINAIAARLCNLSNNQGGFGSAAFGSTLTAGIEEQRLLLTGLLEAANPASGFELLKNCGFVSAFWPELAALNDVDHSKEYHPEGNVWDHTMEALRHRKPGGGGFDLRLSLGLLLHDVGKPASASFGSRRFDGHAELGARTAARFLERLQFEPSLIQDIYYLVKNHMLPAALKRLPLTKTAEIMASPMFPALMELYRCDESSSFKGLDEYYENSAAYQSYLKNLKNPYRSADGKKINNPALKGYT